MSWGWIKRIVPGFVLAAIFFAMPFTKLGEIEPWYFWMGSGVVAFLVGVLLTWIMLEGQKPHPRRRNEEQSLQEE